MDIESIAHKGLRPLAEAGSPKGLIGGPKRIARMLAYIDAAEELEELRIPPNFGFHELTGDRAGAYAMAVTRNWRMTFKVNEDNVLIDMI